MALSLASDPGMGLCIWTKLEAQVWGRRPQKMSLSCPHTPIVHRSTIRNSQKVEVTQVSTDR